MYTIIKINRKNSESKEYLILYGGVIQHEYGVDSLDIYDAETEEVSNPFYNVEFGDMEDGSVC